MKGRNAHTPLSALKLACGALDVLLGKDPSEADLLAIRNNPKIAAALEKIRLHYGI